MLPLRRWALWVRTCLLLRPRSRREDKTPLDSDSTRRRDHEVNVEYRKDQFRKFWYTTGFIDGNEFFYTSSGDGVKCVNTGIWWYRTENGARQVLRAVLSGRPFTVI